MAWLGRAVIAVMAVCAPFLAYAGGSGFTDEDIISARDGPPFFGFVREVDGPGVKDAKVTAALNGGSLVTRTDLLGIYKIPGFGKNINPDDVTISCAKDGYKQANLVRHPHDPSDTKDAIEVDCYLQKL